MFGVMTETKMYDLEDVQDCFKLACVGLGDWASCLPYGRYCFIPKLALSFIHDRDLGCCEVRAVFLRPSTSHYILRTFLISCNGCRTLTISDCLDSHLISLVSTFLQQDMPIYTYHSTLIDDLVLDLLQPLVLHRLPRSITVPATKYHL